MTSAVSENCSVAHTHRNRDLIGGSKAEDHMTRCAMEDVFERHQGSQMPAMACDPYMEVSVACVVKISFVRINTCNVFYDIFLIQDAVANIWIFVYEKSLCINCKMAECFPYKPMSSGNSFNNYLITEVGM